MMILWVCSCGAEFMDPHVAFLHRDGTAFHLVSPTVLDREEQVIVHPNSTLLQFLSNMMAEAN